MAAIDALASDPGPAVYYTAAFRNVLEDHMTYLRGHTSTQSLDVPPILLDRFEFDLPGLLNQFRIPAYMHWVVMRMNSLVSLTDVPRDLKSILVPDGTLVGKLQQVYRTTTKL